MNQDVYYNTRRYKLGTDFRFFLTCLLGAMVVSQNTHQAALLVRNKVVGPSPSPKREKAMSQMVD